MSLSNTLKSAANRAFAVAAVLLAVLCLASGCDSTASMTAASKREHDRDSGNQSLKDSAGKLEAVSDRSASGTSVSGAEDTGSTLSIGDMNPGIDIATWVKGEPVEGELEGKVYVVEFWATWCVPCLRGMPHLSELQQEYADEVVFIGVTREDQATVEEFLARPAMSRDQTWDDVIQYRLAIDNEDSTNMAFMDAAGQEYIPCAFVIGYDGAIEWIGNPGEIDEPLEKIVTKQWDREAAISKDRFAKAAAELNRLARAGQWDTLLEVVDALEEETGDSRALSSFRLQILLNAERFDEASSLREKLIEDAWDDATKLNELAWKAATEPNPQDLKIALKAAKRASELRNDKSSMILNTLARCHYELGDLEEAIKWQTLAFENSSGDPSMEETLEKYRDEKKAGGEAADNAP